MKRILPIFLTLAIVVSCIAIPAFASTAPSGATPPENGGLYNKILYWQDYVLNSTQNISGKWTTRIGLPKASVWELNDNAGWRSDSWYTDNTSSGYFHLDERDLYLEWSNAYYISLEDINYIDFNNFNFIAQSSFLMTSVEAQVVFYDAYLNIVSVVPLGGGLVEGSTVISDNYSFAFGEDNYGLGAKYFRFYVNIGYKQVDPETNQWFNFHWSIDLPFEYDPLRYPVDGIDAWMNGYFKPIVPDMDGEKETWEYFWSQQANLTDIFKSVKESFQYYVVGFRVWTFIFGSFINNNRLSWIKDLLLASFALGAIAFLLDIAVQGAGKVGGKKDKKKDKSKGGKKVQKNRMSASEKRKVPKDKERR